MGEVGDVHLGGDGGMERGDAQIIPPPGLGKVPRKREKRMVCRCTCSKILQAHHIAVGGGVWKRLVVGHTLTWASLGFPTGLFLIELRSWSTLEGRGVRCRNLREAIWRRYSLHKVVAHPLPPR